MTPQLDPDLRRRLRILADVLPLLEAPDFEAGHWDGGDRRPDGSMTVPYFVLSDDALAVLRLIGESGFVKPFDWMAWAATPEAQALRNDRAALAAATPDQLGKLLTMLVREDRFVEGALGASFESGLITAIARRAAVIAR